MLEEPQPAGAVLPGVGELLLQHGCLLALLARCELAEQRAVDRAARPAGADQPPAAIGVVQDVPAVLLTDLDHADQGVDAADEGGEGGHKCRLRGRFS